MNYTKNELIYMKVKLKRLYEMERRYNNFLRFLNGTAITLISGSAVSLGLYINDLMDLEKTVTIGGACFVGSAISVLGSHYVGKEKNNIEDDIWDFEMECPEEVIDEVYSSLKM